MAVQRVNYLLGSAGNYRFNITKMGHHEYDQLSYIHKSDFPDVEVSRPGLDTDLERVFRTCLLTVNGYVHSTAFTAGKLYIPQATHSMLRSRANIIGLLDFSKAAPNITRYTITSDMISQESNMLAYDKVLITFTEPVEQPLLIMAGYIIPYDADSFYRVSDNSFALCLSKLNYMERLYELSRYRDIFKHLDVQVSATNEFMVDTNTVRSFITIQKLLTLHNSFMVDLKTTNFSVNKIFLAHSKIPGTFTTQTHPNIPLFMGYGKLSEYAVRRDNEFRYTVHTQDYHYDNHLLSSFNQNKIKVFNNQRRPGQTHRLSQAFFLDMTVES